MIFSHINELVALCAAHGVKEAIISPGSRSAAITLTFEAHPDINVRMIPDERSAAFIAMGIAQQAQQPVVLVCTSGSAALNYAPAVAEAFYQEVPLIVITADRPPEWVDQYDGQTIRQEGIYANHIKSSFNLPVDLSHSDAKWQANRMVNEALLTAQTAPFGPVHVNVPLREPFYPEAHEEISFETPRVIRKFAVDQLPNEAHWELLLDQWKSATNCWIIVGHNDPSKELTAALSTLKPYANVFSDIIGNQQTEGVITSQDLFLQPANFGAFTTETPDLIITIGKSLISKNLKLFLRKNSPKQHWHINQGERLNDSLQHLSYWIDARPAQFLNELSIRIKDDKSLSNSFWTDRNAVAKEALRKHLAQTEYSELKATHEVMQAMPESTTLHLANSMAVRYANFVGVHSNRTTVYSNRGTSGIDGCNSTALGAALAADQMVTLITGDLAFFYDRNAFWNNEKFNNLRIVILNNDGGGIFGMIKGPRQQTAYQKLFQTPHGLTAKKLCKEFGMSYLSAKNSVELKDVLKHFYAKSKTAKILEIFTDSEESAKDLTSLKQALVV
ncbi:2-succinyl-5-enolpyruvyl-6-hydroxy-3-cyclohexene-1-carboxylic-acid synthase [Roseivirga pacifica]|uniref:2-succinyl-5-enolpyruvyl-6-hydroxy-3- cyclohexene-1-carboxylic-acid synthase n=1 Tax=Roseivirga pacifica TaxID=1267423 RepID=UPI0020962E70|nr:2-succinyl-5-enolpyruvyl-6-hydroxy-3-cyclohexene-1-carboxylic-acid synthase [Roseivirga pacifica]MCO6360946.1 2-succinyl-5-enolpyruvyl-6-hydroxy-3-cyclohexene-1-carboxylic-acid synthase [Roseivirga pacifica]MCO6368835.1 2-succinyl-5-enolpyruvyl-6-hydroxy-3-cyclohexene-1-carboxylic-acid synthase [Roseivirga pacifica]MCO6372979.1 2-succinyl-5-enolpyruvyl-6-hydroxy-3-cyclohexene-1-carboxylic-acid synthase [Roseivirga pacifica]MCO6377039.1 2-succinyl-5-enolpyruvyl-6-hydroxy-3-cyclohexene-1-carbo